MKQQQQQNKQTNKQKQQHRNGYFHGCSVRNFHPSQHGAYRLRIIINGDHTSGRRPCYVYKWHQPHIDLLPKYTE